MRLFFSPGDWEYIDLYGISFDTPYDKRDHALYREMADFCITYCHGSAIGDHFWFNDEPSRLHFVLRWA